MKVSSKINFELPATECIRVTKKMLLDLIGWQKGYYVKEQEVRLEYHVPAGSHGYDGDEHVRDLTELDKAVLLVIKELKEDC